MSKDQQSNSITLTLELSELKINGSLLLLQTILNLYEDKIMNRNQIVNKSATCHLNLAFIRPQITKVLILKIYNSVNAETSIINSFQDNMQKPQCHWNLPVEQCLSWKNKIQNQQRSLAHTDWLSKEIWRNCNNVQVKTIYTCVCICK